MRVSSNTKSQISQAKGKRYINHSNARENVQIEDTVNITRMNFKWRRKLPENEKLKPREEKFGYYNVSSKKTHTSLK